MDFKRYIIHKKEYGIRQSVLIIAVLALFCTVTQYLSSFAGMPSMLLFPYFTILNAIPLFVVMCIVYSLTNRIWTGFLTTAIPFYILLTVNYFKVYFRSETLSIHDFSLVSEAADIMTGYDFPVPYMIILSVILSVLAFMFVFKFVKSTHISFFKRVLLLFISAVIGISSYFCFYGNPDTYKKLPSLANKFNDVSVAEHKGFLFTFLSHISSYEYNMPDGYDISSVIGENKPDEAPVIDTPINVIAIMSEAFFDMENCGNIEFYDGMSPTPNLSRLRRSSKWGHILVPGYAGSTASTEFEFLTGVNISHIDSAMPVVYKTHVTQDTYSIAQMFKDMGYTTEAFHPGNAWFYNRCAVYPRLGFQNAYFLDDFEYTRDDLINYYLSDDVTADKIISSYSDYLSSGNNNGYFSFTVTIQNHGPYSGKEPEIKRIKNNAGADIDGRNALLNYANGLHDADALLGKVCDYIETVNAPTVLVFFGDHLPYFDADGKNLEAIGLDVNSGTPKALENRYSTPYIIHGNSAFCRLFNGGKPDNGCKDNISSSFLVTELLKYMNIGYSPYFKAVSEIGEHISEISGSFYIADGKHTTELNESQKELLKKYEYLSYWALRDYKD